MLFVSFSSSWTTVLLSRDLWRIFRLPCKVYFLGQNGGPPNFLPSFLLIACLLTCGRNHLSCTIFSSSSSQMTFSLIGGCQHPFGSAFAASHFFTAANKSLSSHKTSKYSSIWLPGELLCRLLTCQQREQNHHTRCRSRRKLFSGFLLHPKQFPKASHWTGTSFQTVSASSFPTRWKNCGRFDASTRFQIASRELEISSPANQPF